MPPRLSLFHVPRTLVVRTKPAPQRWQLNGTVVSQCRPYSDTKTDDPRLKDIQERTEQDHNLHVSEEAKVIAESRGDKGPDLQQGTPVEEVVGDDASAQEHLPQVMKDALKKKQQQTPSGSRSFSTLARRNMSTTTPARAAMDMAPFGNGSMSDMDAAVLQSGMTDLMPERAARIKPRHFHTRYQNILEQFVGLLIRDGKKAQAQRYVSLVLSHLRTLPPPALDSSRLVPNHPPSMSLPLNPITYLTLAIDSVAPILRVKQLKGQAGGGAALAVPIPLSLRRRRWEAMNWIIDAAGKRKSRGSGSGMFAQKLAEEVVAVVEGKSAVWARRDMLHKSAVTARANLRQGGKML